MGLKTIRWVNYKGFEDTGTIEIKPITILIGPNSSGKTSFVQPLLMLKQTVDSRDVANPLVVNGSYVQLSSFESFIHNHDIKKELGIELSFEIEPYYFRFPANKEIAQYHLKSQFIYNKSRKRIELNLTDINIDDQEVKIERIKLKKGIKYQVAATYRAENSNELKQLVLPRVTPSKFYDYSLRESYRGRILPLRRLRLTARDALEKVLDNVFYMGPLRENPKHLYITGGELRKDVGLKGEYAADVLWTQSQGLRRARRLIERVKYWIERFGLGSGVKIKTIGRHSGFFQIIITNPETNIDATISNVGFGVSQVLPLIVEGFYSTSNSTILVEQPEIHLHPKVQADLGDLLIDLSKQGRNIIVETHSEHLISRLTRRIAEGENFKSNDLAIYYFFQGKQGSQIQRINVNQLGQFENWPEGFFEEDYAEALIHNKLITERLNEGKENG
ncbi:MAG: DUF3696 domain-containing protein [Nitrospirota bacterium]